MSNTNINNNFNVNLMTPPVLNMPGFHSIMSAVSPDWYNVPKLSTGIDGIDKPLYGGLVPGLTILAGPEGNGKTTLAAQIVTRALKDDQAKRRAGKQPVSRGVMIYSAEMSDGHLHQILARQIADLDDVEDRGREPFHKFYLKEEADRRIRAEYGPWVLGYTPTPSTGGWFAMRDALDAAAQVGVRIFVVDNLLTLTVLLSQSPEYHGAGDNTLQSAATAWLAEFAAKYNAWVIMVAHTRKESQWSAQNRNDTISGASAMKNLATQVLFFDELAISKRETLNTTDRCVYLTKNRVFNKKCLDGVTTRYIERTMTVEDKDAEDGLPFKPNKA